MQRIKKIQVCTGVFWVEVPEANAYVLCGCPADSVKHLIRCGLIVPNELSGVLFETGPNIILLSDLMLQNGMFSNMAEFPVLQMLYRQGMAVPGHPGNTGTRPLIAGSSEQIEAQLQYIYRGNYGLVSRSELMAAGASATLADELMAMKLKFSFGKIRDSRDFLDTCVIDSSSVELRAGLTVRRQSVNVFEFEYAGESVRVDLNLKPSEKYPSPFSLGFHHIKREYFAVLHSGEGDGWDINRPPMQSILMFQGKIYLIDAGPGVMHSLESLGISVNEIEGIFHTHSHDDHFAGLPALMRTDRRLKYFATPLVRASVLKKMSALLSLESIDLDHYFDIVSLDYDAWNDIEGLEVKPMHTLHPVETSIFQFRTLWNGGYKVYAHYADIASFSVIDGMVRQEPGGAGISQEFADKIKRDCLEPVDVKKIDIGGGMIHGWAEDFRSDSSRKIVLAHSASELNDAQKEIGSQAAFGTVDVLIPSLQDYGLRSAFGYLQEDFQAVNGAHFRMLLNNPTPVLNPGTIVIREGECSEFIYLILSGYIEMIQSARKVNRQLFAGTLIGEISALREKPSRHTYRTMSYVQALQIPSSLYRDFVRINNLYTQIERLQEAWVFLAESKLFSTGIPYTMLNRLVKNIRETKLPFGHRFDLLTNSALHLIRAGTVERLVDGRVVESLNSGDVFGEGAVIGLKDELSQFRVASESADMYAIEASDLEYVPIFRWRLRELSLRRVLGS